MRNRTRFLTLLSLFLSVLTVSSAWAQTRIAGVHQGDWFRYGEFYVLWNSNDPSFNPDTISHNIQIYAQLDFLTISVRAISNTFLTLSEIRHFKNGTEINVTGWVDVDTGWGSESVFIVSAGLLPNDAVYTSADFSQWKINETIVRTYSNGPRETNHLSFEYTGNVSGDYSYSHFYWDRVTGVLTEFSEESRWHSGQDSIYLTTISWHYRLVEANAWVVPEFPSMIILPLFMLVSASAILIYKKSAA